MKIPLIGNLFDDLASGKIYNSLIVLIIANLIPLFGVLFFGWSSFEILLLYWSESAIIGLFTILKIILAKGKPMNFKINKQPVIVTNDADLAKLKLFLIPFFMFHYGMFMIVHLIFILALSPHTGNTAVFQDGKLAAGVSQSILNVASAFLALFISHAISFKSNYLDGKENETAEPGKLMSAPYGRIIVMQMAIVFGAILGIPAVILVLGKTILDLGAHSNERRAFSASVGKISLGSRTIKMEP